ncbi:MAG TPA: protein kinase family protein, partial [Streptomyces sp.]
LTAVSRASSSLVLFLEHVPRTLGDWLREHRGYAWVEEGLARGTAFMSSRGLVHFDAHFANVLTDGRLLYFADFGLALSSEFELSAAEAEFLSGHLSYDRAHTASHLLRHHLPDGLRGGMEHDAFLRAWIAGHRPDGVPRAVSAILDRHARTAVIFDEFARRLLTESKRTPFPAAEIAYERVRG